MVGGKHNVTAVSSRRTKRAVYRGHDHRAQNRELRQIHKRKKIGFFLFLRKVAKIAAQGINCASTILKRNSRRLFNAKSARAK